MKKKPAKKPETPDEKLPGYPHYPVKDDIMNNDAEKRIDVDVENLSGKISRDRSLDTNKKTKTSATPKKPNANKTGSIPSKETDVTSDDLKALGSPDRSNDGGDDELLDDIAIGPDFSGDDLDVPGAELDDDMEDLGSEDEENNYYSRGQE
jgi:hypothetical protein